MRNPDLEDRITKGLRYGYWRDRKLATVARCYFKGSDMENDWSALKRAVEIQTFNFESSIMLRFLVFILLVPVASALCAYLAAINIAACVAGFVLLTVAVSNAWLSMRYVWYDYDKENFGFFTNWHKLLLQYVKNNLLEEGGELNANN